MGGAIRLLVNCTSMEVSNLLEILKYGVMDFHIRSIFRLALSPHGGVIFPMEIMVTVSLVPVLSMENGVEHLLIPL